MAIAMGVGWRTTDMGSAVMSKKRSWGDDPQKLFDLMIGASNTENTSHTLDLLGGSSSSSLQQQFEFVELQDTEMPLPSGWEKRLDLKSGAVYFVNWSTGRSTHVDPRKPLKSAGSSISHGFLSIKQSEEMLQQKVFFSSEHQHYSKPRHDVPKFIQNIALEDNKKQQQVELNLKLSSISDELHTSVCTMEKVQQALARSQNQASYIFLDATATSVDRGHLPWPFQYSAPSPATSTSSSSSSATFSSKRPKMKVTKDPSASWERNTIIKGSENVDVGSSIVMLTVCKNCFMYVMLSASDPRCPRCSTTLILKFPLSGGKSKVELNL